MTSESQLRRSLPRSRAEELALSIEEDIRQRQLVPGDMVGTLHEIRAQTGLARSTVSEAVRLLRERGMLEIRPGRGGGLFLAQRTPVVQLRHTLLNVASSATATQEAIELREALELFIAVQAARHRTDDDVLRLRRSLQLLREAQHDWEAFMQANWALHRDIAAICPNEMARAVYLSTLGYLQQSSAGALLDENTAAGAGYRRRRVEVHEKLVESIIDARERDLPGIVQEHNSPD
ncbi:FCD domain-containing protein [Glutamicibacter sp. JL.03c]|uniref:FadR/GntR family transcriptional regulator n=1 Tax=Glutamicibacter sp. JL.03c TaxID=2984842 RepID=UPI0021F7FB67|nr:FCD domain-containing protein [Glutamicibacter sp. JL.03c]UYQ77270.1 FCD domain-containing protein [Glutamicibacter sp. JL.03c]